MYRAVDVAYKMLQDAKVKRLELSNLQLQKLLYIAHGYLLAWKNKPLFNDEISAWKYGPVIHSVYTQFKDHGSRKIPVDAIDEIETGVNDEDIKAALDGVLTLYGDRNAMELVNITHQKNTPWDKIWNAEGGSKQLFAEIPNDLIKDHYRKVIENPSAVSGL